MWLKGIKDESMKEKCKHCSQLNNLKSTFFVMNTPGHELALPMHQFIFLWNQNIVDKPEWFLFISCRGFCPSHYCKLIIMLKCPLCAKRWEGKCPPLIILQEGKCPNPAKNRGGIVLPTWFEQGGKCPGGKCPDTCLTTNISIDQSTSIDHYWLVKTSGYSYWQVFC